MSRKPQVVFVHGMGRSPLSAVPLLWRLWRAGHTISVFWYVTPFSSAAAIADRLHRHIQGVAAHGPYAVVGHSLGGVLTRCALQDASPATHPAHLFLLGSPIGPSRLAARLKNNPIFRWSTGDCGRLLCSDNRMKAIPMPTLPTTIIFGTQSLPFTRSAFGQEPNDGVVGQTEIHAPSCFDQVPIPVLHALLPASHHAASIILDRLAFRTPITRK